MNTIQHGIGGPLPLPNRPLPLARILLVVFVGCFTNSPAFAQSEKPQRPEIDFNRDIRPILSDKCFHCHGPDRKHRKAGLRLDTHQGVLEDLGGYQAVVPGDPDESELIFRIGDEDPDSLMPPLDSGKKLEPREIELLTEWVRQGAAWQEHWAYVAPKRNPIPTVSDPSWGKNWIDSFILSKLDSAGLRPSRKADRVTLIRRLYFDLIGLPPTPEEVDKFVNDRSPDAYERVVDRLLDSPRYGERMAMYWLDLVRYADTVGYHGDQPHNIGPYRDWVIEALNTNMPFDQFTREQLAGDLVEGSTIQQKIASGYNRLLQTSHEGGVQPKEYMAIYAADRVRNVSSVWMGATVGCAQCHDHKYDPYTAEDFYSLAAFFSDVDEARHFKEGTNQLPTRRPPEMTLYSRQEKEELASLAKQIAELDSQLAKVETADKKKRFNQQRKRLVDRRGKIERQAVKTMITVALEKPRETRVLPRGNWLDDSGPIVQPAVPGFLPAIVNEGRANRLDLANWLSDSKEGYGGMMARVFANRFFYLFYGVGLSKSLEDFGAQGQPPVHPELLDNLAVEFVESGWDIKHLVRLLVTSQTYRQSSSVSKMLLERDPYNQLFARQMSYRLPAETIRDNALAVSGLLVLKHQGRSIKPYQPAGLYRHLNFPVRKYHHDGDARQWQRGVYIHWQRQFLHPMLKSLDAPTREECTAERPRSNTPLAALTLLNDPTFVEAARAFADRVLDEGGMSDEQRLQFAFRWALSRVPDSKEAQVLNRLLESSRESFRDDKAAATKLVTVGLSKPRNGDVVELAAWTTVARAIFNMSETISRN